MGIRGKNVLATLATLILLIPVAAEAQDVVWTRQLGTSVEDVALAVAVSNVNEIYVAGYTSGNLAGSSGGRDAFLRRYDPAGNVVWTRQFGSAFDDMGTSVAVNGSDVYVGGTTFGSLEPGVGPDPRGDGFVRRFNTSGIASWTRQIGGFRCDPTCHTIEQSVTALAADSSGVAAVGGEEGDGLVRRFSPSGDNLFFTLYGSPPPGTTIARSVALSGNFMYVAGATTAGVGQPPTGGSDAWVVRHDLATNSTNFRHTFGTVATDAATSVTADNSGNFYVAGVTCGSLGDPHAGGCDAFVRRYSSTAGVVITHQFGTPQTDIATGLTTDSTGNLYVSGNTNGSLFVSSAGSNDIFVARHNGDRNIREWGVQFGGSGTDLAFGLDNDRPNGPGRDLYLAGSTTGSLGGPNAGGTDAFLTRLMQRSCWDTANPTAQEGRAPVNQLIHDVVEPTLSPVRSVVHQINCEVIVPRGL